MLRPQSELMAQGLPWGSKAGEIPGSRQGEEETASSPASPGDSAEAGSAPGESRLAGSAEGGEFLEAEHGSLGVRITF